MKLVLSLGVYDGDKLIDTVRYVVAVAPFARIVNQIPEDSENVYVDLEEVNLIF